MRISWAASRHQAGRHARPREPGVLIGLPVPRLHLWHPQRGGLASSSRRAVRQIQAAAAARSLSPMVVPAFTTWVRALPSSHSNEAITGVERPLLRLQKHRAALKSESSKGANGVGGALQVGNHSGSDMVANQLSACPTLPRHWWPLGAARGYCAATEGEGDCQRGSKGSFAAFERRGLWRSDFLSLSIRECAALCAQCQNCRYISVSLSPDTTDCSWYRECDGLGSRPLPTLPGASFVSLSLESAQRYTRSCRAQFQESAC